MHKTIKNNYIKMLKLTILLSVFFTSACVYDKEFAYMNDQIVNLNKRILELQDAVDEELNDKEKGFESEVKSISSNQSELRLEIDQLRSSVQELSGRIEENEHLLKRSVEKDLNEQDSIKAELNDLSQLEKKIQELENALLVQQAYLNLEQDGKDGVLITDKKDIKPREIPKNSELDLYNRAYDMYEQGNIDGAMDNFNKFLTEFPNSDRADNAQFWIGECLMAMKQHKKAILAYEDVIKKYPNGNKVPNAMLRQAIAFQEINDLTSSRLILQKVIKNFPSSSEAEIAKSKLKQLN